MRTGSTFCLGNEKIMAGKEGIGGFAREKEDAGGGTGRNTRLTKATRSQVPLKLARERVRPALSSL